MFEVIETQQDRENDRKSVVLPDRAHVGYVRYEKLRKLNPREYAALVTRSLKGERSFDTLVDQL